MASPFSPEWGGRPARSARWQEAQSGRPVREAAGATAETDPASLGLPVTIWTIDRLRLYLEEQTEVLLSPARFRALLHRLGYRWKQPKQT
ncbi:MAG: winged helix-turn-helix domain-containing protein [Chloroflexi bacterium]|nr:winged helix-turn-helix domain-containing protein [Chloroflexota bacterium]